MAMPLTNLLKKAALPRCRESALLAVIVAVHLVPVWVFPYFPTQDGPAHLMNSLVLKDYGRHDNRFQEFYRICWQPLPNWTCFVLQAVFATIMPAVAAEKLLVSLYLVGFAFAYRYFLTAMGNSCPWLAAAGLLLAFNRCFWLGFYNYCLSLVLLFVTLGYLLRRWDDFRPRDAFVLCMLFCLIFFTHIFGFVLAAGSCLFVAVTLAPRGVLKTVWLIAALLPVCALAANFFEQAEFVGESGFGKLEKHLFSWVERGQHWQKIKHDLLAINMETFGINPHSWVTLSVGTFALYGGFLVAGFWKGRQRTEELRKRVWVVLALGVGLACLYFVAPNVLTVGKGGFWKTRLVLLPPLLWLSCARESSAKMVRYGLGAATFLLLSFHLGLVSSYIRDTNRELAEFTAGVDAIGKDRVIFFNVGQDWEPAVKPLLHAGAYYCLESQNIVLGGQFATVLHSVVRLRPEIAEMRGDFDSHPNRGLADIIVFWNRREQRTPEDFTTIFSEGRLTIMRRTRTETEALR